MASNPAPFSYSNAVLLCECEDLSMMSDAQWESLRVSCRKYRLDLPARNKRQRTEVEVQAPAPSQDIQDNAATYPGADPFGPDIVTSQAKAHGRKRDPRNKQKFPFHSIALNRKKASKSVAPPEEEAPEPWIALSDLWPSDTCTYSTKIAKREGDAVAVLTTSSVPGDTDIRPFQGWTPREERYAEISEDQPKAAVVSLLLASWLRDADVPLDMFRAISTTSVLWASTRHKTLWMYVDAEADWVRPRPTVEVRDPNEINPWNYIEINPCVMGWLHLPSIAPLCDLAGIPLQIEGEPLQDDLHEAGLPPLLLKIDDLPGVCYNGR